MLAHEKTLHPDAGRFLAKLSPAEMGKSLPALVISHSMVLTHAHHGAYETNRSISLRLDRKNKLLIDFSQGFKVRISSANLLFSPPETAKSPIGLLSQFRTLQAFDIRPPQATSALCFFNWDICAFKNSTGSCGPIKRATGSCISGCRPIGK
jgi:hypothetical protein